MSEGDDSVVLVINPLKHTLAHYESELLATLNYPDRSKAKVADTVAGDGIAGPLERVAVGARSVWQRERLAWSVRGRIIIVAWPLFGYLEPLTLFRLARHNTVFIVVHDPSPLRRAYGQSSWARRLFKKAASHPRIEIIYHTEHAQRVGMRDNGVTGRVVPHPVLLRPSQTKSPPVVRTASKPVVRVLGQYKNTRSLTALTTIADRAAGAYQLEIHGRGWPEVRGWTVINRFVPEHEFTTLLKTSDCVVIPYDLFFQSGVAVRCLEVGVPVVAPRHEHISQLFGAGWPGIVRDTSDWFDALARALAVDSEEIRLRHERVAEDIRTLWQELLSTAGEVTDNGVR